MQKKNPSTLSPVCGLFEHHTSMSANVTRQDVNEWPYILKLYHLQIQLVHSEFYNCDKNKQNKSKDFAARDT